MRPPSQSETSGAAENAAGSSLNAISMAPTTAAATNSMPRNRRPLPRNTVAKKRSSRRPSWSRMTPMNHRKAIPAKGIRLSASATSFGVGGEPCARRLRLGGDRAPEQSEARQGQQRKDDARDGGGLRGFQSGLGETVDLAHALNSSRRMLDRPNRRSSIIIFEPAWNWLRPRQRPEATAARRLDPCVFASPIP